VPSAPAPSGSRAPWDLGVAAVQAGRPEGIPIVVERTTDAPGLGQLEIAIAARNFERWNQKGVPSSQSSLH